MTRGLDPAHLPLQRREDFRYRRPWLLEVVMADGRRAAYCYVCDLGRWWWNPGRCSRFVWIHRACGFSEAGDSAPELADLQPWGAPDPANTATAGSGEPRPHQGAD